MSTTVITPNNPQYSTTGPWWAWAGAWAAGSLTYGVDYTQSISLNNTTFPNGTLFSWSFPLYGGPFGVWSYPCIVYGSTPELINSAVPSTQVANFVNLSTSYSAALTVNSGQLDTIFDIWLTSKPYGDVTAVKYELEIVPQTDWHAPASTLAYTLTDSTLLNAGVYVNPNFGGNGIKWTNIGILPSSEMLSGSISISDILKSLIWHGVLTGQEYISGIEFGPEPGSGSGSLLVNNLNYQWNGTSTIQGTAGNDTFHITISGGNDVVGNGGVDTVIYSGLHSQFEIKTSGSETLVTQANNISTLDYLQGVTFIQFSDGIYNVPTSSFTPGLPAPVVTATNQTAAAGQSVPLSSIYSVSGSGITEYRVWFSWPEGGDPADGTVTNNGTPIAADQWDTVSSLSGLAFVGSVTPGTDHIWLQAYNGSWSNSSQATITDAGLAAPVVTATNQTVAAGQSVPLSSIYSVSGSGITAYRVWFSWPEGGDPADGTVTNNGTPIAADQWDTVSSLSSLSGLAFVGSVTPGTDHIWLQAYNGSWSNSSQATITDAGLAAPVVTATNQTVAAGQSVPLSSIYSVSGSGITEYRVWFSWPEGGDPADGTVTNNGTPIAADQWDTVSSLSGLAFVGSVTPGTDHIWLQAYNGSWSNSSQATITDAGLAAPVVTATNQTVAAGQSVPLSSIYSVSGSGITEYRVWFSWPEGGDPADGTVTNNGTPIAADQWDTVSSLSGLAFVGSVTPGTDHIWLQAYNGSWSNSSQATITDAGLAAPVVTAFTISDSSTIGAGAFAGSTGTLQLDSSSSFSGTVAGMSGQDILDLRDISPATVATPTFSGNSSGGTLPVTDGAHSANIALLGNYLASTFVAPSDGHGGTNIVDPQLISSNHQTLVTQPQHA